MSIPKKYLTEKVILIEARIDDKSILRILTQNKQINKADPDYSYYVQLANWANSSQEKTGKIDLSTIKLSDRSLIQKGKLANNTKHLGTTLEQLKNLMNQEGKYDPNSDTSNLIQKTTLEILAGMSGIKNTNPPIDKEDSPEDKQNLYAGMDWTAEKARRLKNANGKATSKILDKFYNDYYKIEYAGLKSSKENDTQGIVDKLKSLDKILIQEFNKLGYNPSVNPLAQFLKNLIKYKDKIFFKLNTNNYGAIHNSFIDKYITGNMLGNYDTKNILSCEDLYNYKGLDMVKYLSFQNKLISKAETNNEYSSDPWSLTIKILIQQGEPKNARTYEEKVKSLKELSDLIEPADSNARLRSISEISELYRYIFNETADIDDTEENLEIKKIVERAKRKQVVLSMIRFILGQAEFKNKYPKEAKTYADWLEEIQYKQNNDKIEKSKKILADSYRISTEGKLKLVKKLITAYNATNGKRLGAKN